MSAVAEPPCRFAALVHRRRTGQVSVTGDSGGAGAAGARAGDRPARAGARRGGRRRPGGDRGRARRMVRAPRDASSPTNCDSTTSACSAVRMAPLARAVCAPAGRFVEAACEVLSLERTAAGRRRRRGGRFRLDGVGDPAAGGSGVAWGAQPGARAPGRRLALRSSPRRQAAPTATACSPRRASFQPARLVSAGSGRYRCAGHRRRASRGWCASGNAAPHRQPARHRVDCAAASRRSSCRSSTCCSTGSRAARSSRSTCRPDEAVTLPDLRVGRGEGDASAGRSRAVGASRHPTPASTSC